MTNQTPSQPDRMDRIEAALERLEQSQEATQAQLDRQIPVIADPKSYGGSVVANRSNPSAEL